MDFNKHVQKSNDFLKELAAELGNKKDINRAYRILRAVFHSIRNHIPMEESFQLISQLPMMLKAIYVDGWNINKKKNISRKQNHFIEEIMRSDWPALSKDFKRMEDGITAAKTVFRVLERHVSEGEYKDIGATLPKELKELLRNRIQYKKIRLNKIHQVVKA